MNQDVGHATQSAYFKSIRNLLIPLTLFTISFIIIPLRQFRGLDLIPGDLGDARFNNYVLETIYLRLTGKVDSFWNMEMFFPYPLVGGFSDNHIGSALFYVVPRLFLSQPDTAFQLWFLIGYFLNFVSAYIAFRKLGMSTFGASVGSAIFAFAFPTSVHAIHAQLHHRWALPMAILAISKFLKGHGPRWLGIAALWAVLQFYIGFYTGFFTSLFIVAVIFAHVIIQILKRFFSRKSQSNEKKLFDQLDRKTLTSLIFMMFISIGGLTVLFYPYYQVSKYYVGFRSWEEISSMLPRPQSYFLIDNSFLWQNVAQSIEGIPQRWEHQMFVGAVPLALFIFGAIAVLLTRNRTGLEIYVAAALIIIFTLFVNGTSLWFYLHNAPLFSAIRAVSRVDQTLLFAVGYGAALFISWVGSKQFKKFFFITPLLLVLTLLALAEASTGTISTSEKTVWRDRISNLEKQVPQNLPDDSVLFFAQTDPSDLWFAHELDSMWVALKYGKPTINGYSGQAPPNWLFTYGTDCQVISNFNSFYQRWMSSNTYPSEKYLALKNKIVPIGFTNCDNASELIHP